MSMSGFGLGLLHNAYDEADDLEEALAFSRTNAKALVAQRKVLAGALRAIDPNHPALQASLVAYDAAAREEGPRQGIKRARVDAWLASQQKRATR